MALQVFGFYNGLDEKAKGYRFLERYGGVLDEIALFNIGIQSNGELRGRPSRRLIKEAHSHGLKVWIVVSNLTPRADFSTPLLSRLIREGEFAAKVWRNIRNLMAEYQCDGVNLDLEKALPEDRQLFTRLIQSWSEQFHNEHYLVSIDVPAKTADLPMAPWKGAFDYRAIGKAVDEVILMTYEEHWPGSDPGSVASLPWVTKVLDYALANIPASKIYMGIPLYGYDWLAKGSAQVIGYQRAVQVAKQYGAPVRWDEEQHSTYFSYERMGQRHTVYFEDLRSLREKLELAKRKGIKGIALWEMNLSYPELWEALPANV